MSSFDNGNYNNHGKRSYIPKQRQYTAQRFQPKQNFHFSSNNFSFQNRFHNTETPSQQFENITFKITNLELSGPTISIPILYSSFLPQNYPAFLSQFKLLADVNQWDAQKAYKSLLIVLSDELRDLMTNVQTIDEAIQILQNFFFPPTNFFLYKDQMSALDSNNYNTVSDYLINLRKLQKLANLTVSSEEALLEREILQIFLNGLPFHLRQMAASQRTLQLKELATKLDDAVFISKNLKHKSINNFKNYRNKNFVKKWCDLHKTNSHSNHECYKQNQRKQNNFERENKKLEERLFCPRVKILLKSSQEPVKALLDSGSSRTLINPKHIKILNKEPLEKPIMFNCSNNQKTSCYEKSLLKFSFPEGDRNSFFSHEIILSQYIPDTMIIGLDFMKKVEGNIMFGKDTFDIHDISIPLILDNSINKKENFQNNDKKILSTKNIDIKDIKSLIEYTKSVYSKHIGVFPNYEHKIELFSDVNTLNK